MDNIEYSIVRSRRKSVSIQVKASGQVIVRAPMRVSKKVINQFVLDNYEWIEKTIEKMEVRQQESEKLPRFTKEQIADLKKTGKKEITALVEKYAPIVGVTYGRVSIRAQKSRWGSCSRDGNLNFNCLLMMCPEEVREYVVVHELCHRLEMNHSERFWAQVEKVLPNYKQLRKWLKTEGGEIIRHLP